MSEQLYSLTDAIAALRTEISLAVHHATDEQLKFSLGEIELEFSVVARHENAADGKLKFSILGMGAELGAGAKVSREQVQKVRLKLHAQYKAGDAAQGEILVGRAGKHDDFPFK